MKYLNKLATLACFASLGMVALTGCEGSEEFSVDSPSWISEKVDSIKNANSGNEEVLEPMVEDVYTIGSKDFSTGWWSAWSKYYQIPEGKKWNAQFNLYINPAATNTFKNFALVICNDEDRGAANYKEYGAIRFDNQPSGNSEWGDYIDRSLVQSNLTFGTDTDEGVEKLAGLVTLIIDRTDGGLRVKMDNGTVTKTYTQTAALENLNADASNTTIRAFLCPEGSYIDFQQTSIEPIGGCTSAEDKNPLSMVLKNVPNKVMVGTDLAAATAGITATITFEQEVTKDVTAAELQFQTIPDLSTVGIKTLVAMYNKTYKGENCDSVISVQDTIMVVDKMYTCVGATDNTGAFWSEHSDKIKVNAGETFVATFTNYTCGEQVYHNFLTGLTDALCATEYGVLRADIFGWGLGYDACTHSCDYTDAATWLAAMNGAKVTVFVSNNGDGTADLKYVMLGNDGVTYKQEFIGINNVVADDFYFHFTIEKAHIEFDTVTGKEDNTDGFWAAHSEKIQIPSGKTYSIRFKNYTCGEQVYHNFLTVLTDATGATEYGVLRADNFGWGLGYDACTHSCDYTDAATWLAAMNGSTVTVTVTNKGDGTADVKYVMLGNDGVTYNQEFTGINNVVADDFYFHFTIEKAHIVFE